MRVLFIKPALVWPRTSGHDVYCYYMMNALAAEGVEVSLATVAALDPRATEPIPLAYCRRVTDAPDAEWRPRLTWLQERYRSFWGVSVGQLASIRRIVAETEADVVVAFGLPALPFLGGVESAVRVWAMADEWVYHHLTQVRLTQPGTWHHLRTALIKGVYERAYSGLVDRVWAVSDTDRRAARWLAGMPVGDLLPNGVDTEFYRPIDTKETSASAIFWGRLDFEPNIDALLWFCRTIWPQVRERAPDAQFTIMGYQPSPEVERLTAVAGVSLQPNVADLRPAVCQHALVVLPMISGGGIKNKLLEGAAMGRPIVATPRACLDLKPAGGVPVVQARTADEFAAAMLELWSDGTRRAELGRQARLWVSEYYSWSTPGRNALTAFQESLDRRAAERSRDTPTPLGREPRSDALSVPDDPS